MVQLRGRSKLYRLTRAIQNTVKQKTGDVARDTTPSKNRPALKNRALTTGAFYKFASVVIAHRLGAGVFVAIAAAAAASVLLRHHRFCG
jgi:hypothetical protein